MSIDLNQDKKAKQRLIEFKAAKNPADLDVVYEAQLKTKSIAVIVPMYNVACFLRQCLESILSQSHSNFKVFLCDDESSDESLEIALEYAKKDSRVLVFSQKNAGQGSARNLGILTASSRLIFKEKEKIQSDFYEELEQKFQKELELKTQLLNAYELEEFKTELSLKQEQLKEEFKEYEEQMQDAQKKDLKTLFYYKNTKLIKLFMNEKAYEEFELMQKQALKELELGQEKTLNFDYLCFIDSDDFIKPHTFKNYLFYIQDADFLYAGFEYFFDGLKKDEGLKTHFQNYGITQEGLISANDFIHINFDSDIRSFCFVYQGMIYHSLIYEQNLLYPGHIYAEDLLFGVLLVGVSKKIYVLQKDFYVYRIRPSSSSAYDKSYKAPPRFAKLLEEFEDYEELKSYLKIQSSIITAQKILQWTKNYEDKEKATEIKRVFLPTYVKRARAIMSFEKDPLWLKSQFIKLRPYYQHSQSVGAAKRVQKQLSYKLGSYLYFAHKYKIFYLFLPFVFVFYFLENKLRVLLVRNKVPLYFYKDYEEALLLQKSKIFKLGQYFLKASFKKLLKELRKEK